MPEKVKMRSPSGEIREVDGTPEALTPLMAAGWHQCPPKTEPAAGSGYTRQLPEKAPEVK